MKVIAVVSEPIGPDELRQAVGAEAEDAEVLVIAPALQTSPLRFWLSDADEAIGRATEVAEQSAKDLADAGVDAQAGTGEADVAQSVVDALRTFPADRVIVFAHAEGDEAYREAEGVAEAVERFGAQLVRVPAAG